MRKAVANDLSDSAFDFERVVLRAVSEYIGKGRLVSVETSPDDPMKHALDVLAGIDAWQMFDQNGAMRGIASRVQWVPDVLPRRWRTFTVRKDRLNGTRTEQEKMMYRFMHPDAAYTQSAVTIQAYVREPKRKGPLIAAAVIRTRDLCEYMCTHPPTIAGLVNKQERGRTVIFDAYSWSDLQDAGYDVAIAQGDGSLCVASAMGPPGHIVPP